MISTACLVPGPDQHPPLPVGSGPVTAPPAPGETILLRSDAAPDSGRFFRIEVSRDLFGGILITREWGLSGRRGQRMSRWCASGAEAANYIDTLLRARLRRGYRPVS